MTTREVFRSSVLAAIIVVALLIILFIAESRFNDECRARGGEPSRIGCVDPKVFK